MTPAAGAEGAPLRLVAIAVALAITMSARVVAFAVVGDDAVHHSARAAELTLRPISTPMQVGSTVYADDGHTVLAVRTERRSASPCSCHNCRPP